jgi:hypothetical protein
MENGKRRIGIQIFAGCLLALTIIALVFASGITLPSSENNQSTFENTKNLATNQGKLTILLMDAPVQVDELWINVTGVEVHKTTTQSETEDQNQENDNGWISIDLSGADPNELVFDLLKYRLENEGDNNILLNLASGETAEGTYNKIRIQINNATARYYLRDENGDIVTDTQTANPVIEKDQPLKIPSNRIDVITKFTIDSQNPVIVLIDMQPDWIAISKSGNLRPVMKATVSQQNPTNAEIETINQNEGEETT